MNAKRLLLIVSLLFIAACGAGSPSGPVQLPQTIEYAGKSVSDDYINVQTDTSIYFAVKDQNGEIMSPETVTGTILDKDGNAVSDDSYGTLGISDDGQYIEYTANQYFPDLITTAGLTFTSNVAADNSAVPAKGLKADAVLPGFDLGISAGIDQIKTGEYAFRDFVAEATYGYSGPKMAVSATTGNIYLLMMNVEWNGSIWALGGSLALTSTSVANVENGTSSELTFTPIKQIADYSDVPTTSYIYTSIAAYDDNTMAVMYTTYDYQNSISKTDVYLTFTTDAGTTWTTPMNIISYERDDGSADAILMNMKYDRNGILHMIYYHFLIHGFYEHSVNDLFYTTCSTSGCDTAVQINSTPNTAGHIWLSMPQIAVDDRDSSTVKIYTSWLYLQGDQIFTYPTMLSEIDYDVASGSASVARTIQVQSSSSSECANGVFESLVLDTQYSPIVSWLQFSGVDPSCVGEPTSADLKTARYNTVSGTLDTPLKVYTPDISLGFYPKLIITNTDYSNTAYVSWLESNLNDETADSRLGYSMEMFDPNTSLFSMIDTIENQPAPFIRTISAYTSNERFGLADSITDRAGRSYFVWFNKDTGKMVFTIGTLWR